MIEKASYTGPWQVPWKRAKKDPSAPKRPMSAFLYFSQGRRSKLKDANPTLKNTEVSRLLGELWRKASEDDKKPHIEKEKHERGKYKIAIAQWREEFEAKVEEQRKNRVEQAVNWGHSYNQEGGDGPNPQMPYGDPNMYSQPPPFMPPPQYYQPYGYRKYPCC
jgi:hypothetical protein